MACRLTFETNVSESLSEPIPQAEPAKEYLGKHVYPTLLIGLTELCKQKPLNPYVSLLCLFVIFVVRSGYACIFVSPVG